MTPVLRSQVSGEKLHGFQNPFIIFKSMTATLYGIPNCDTMRKARRWLADHNIDYRFHDYRKDGVDPALAKQWLDTHGWETVINRRGATWRKLDENTRNTMDVEQALQLMQTYPAIIKRPLLATREGTLIGFSEASYHNWFKP